MKLISKKLCNALIESAETVFIVDFIMEKLEADKAIKVAKEVMGGLWVGGNAFLYEDAIQFKPNMLNAIVHKGNVSWRIPLEKIIEVKTEFGFFTRIIKIKTDNVTFKIRCYGANKFAVDINEQIKMVKR